MGTPRPHNGLTGNLPPAAAQQVEAIMAGDMRSAGEARFMWWLRLKPCVGPPTDVTLRHVRSDGWVAEQIPVMRGGQPVGRFATATEGDDGGQ